MKMLIGLATFWDVAPFWADGPNPKFAIKKMKNRKKGRRKKSGSTGNLIQSLSTDLLKREGEKRKWKNY